MIPDGTAVAYRPTGSRGSSYLAVVIESASHPFHGFALIETIGAPMSGGTKTRLFAHLDELTPLHA